MTLVGRPVYSNFVRFVISGWRQEATADDYDLEVALLRQEAKAFHARRNFTASGEAYEQARVLAKVARRVRWSEELRAQRTARKAMTNAA